MSRSIYIALLLSLVIDYVASDCAYPTTSEVEDVVYRTLRGGDNPEMFTVEVEDFHAVCLVHDDQRGRYRFVSLVVEYTCSGSGLCPSQSPTVEQFESECGANEVWRHSVLSSVDHTRTQNPTADFSTNTREDCALCVSTAYVEANSPSFSTLIIC